MNEIKLSSQVRSDSSQRLCVRLDPKSLGIDWNESDTIRAMCYKSDGRIVLKRVGGKYAKQVAYTLTKTGGGGCAHQLGVYITQKKGRFNSLKKCETTVPAVRKMNGNCVELYLPKEIFN